jgi:hypothetical protein
LVVRFNNKMGVGKTMVYREQQPKLYRDDLSPADIASVLVLTWTELPEVPFIVEDDTYAPG